MKTVRWSPHMRYLIFLVCLFLMGIAIMLLPRIIQRALLSSRTKNSVWMFRGREGFEMVPVVQAPAKDYGLEASESFDPSKSPYMMPPGSPVVEPPHTEKLPKGDVPYKTIGFFDPLNELSFFMKQNFSQCQYNKCKMVLTKESADAVFFLVAKLTTTPLPKFKRKPGQLWILKTDEAPSRFTWFKNLNQTGWREHFNLTLTHKLDSDIVVRYGWLMERDEIPQKDYSKIYDGKTKTAAWFVSHCPVRSTRLQFVEKMNNRTDVDVFGECGTLTCGQGKKIPGVVGLRIKADKETCFPMLTSTYKFYLAFENSLCQEYISEKFFKIFNDVDVVPVVRGGANYKSYFPPDTFVDASDFSTPEALADYLDDLGSDKDRYITYLKNKNKYRMVEDFPEWHCKLCEKLHTLSGPHVYKNVHDWWVRNSCHDPMDSATYF